MRFFLCAVHVLDKLNKVHLLKKSFYLYIIFADLSFSFTGSSLSNRGVTYTSRSASCQPTRMYQNEDIRTAAKLNRPPSKVYLCQEERDRVRSAGRPKSPTRFDGSPVELPGFMKSNYFLHHEDLNMGQKQYIWGVARIYSVTQLMSLKQRQYQSLLDYEFSRRIQNKELKEHERVKEWKEYQRYCKFIKRYDQVILKPSFLQRDAQTMSSLFLVLIFLTREEKTKARSASSHRQSRKQRVSNTIGNLPVFSLSSIGDATFDFAPRTTHNEAGLDASLSINAGTNTRIQDFPFLVL